MDLSKYEERLKCSHDEISNELSLGKEIMEESWNIYIKVCRENILQEQHFNFLCCPIYVACFEHEIKVMLNKLVRLCQITLREFLKNMRSWLDIIQTTDNLRMRIDKMSRSFSVTVILYEKYTDIFKDIFGLPGDIKKGLQKCSTTSQLYEFGWLLLICVKMKLQHIASDLVGSYYILLCCIDELFQNVSLAGNVDLVNNFSSRYSIDWKNPPASIISLLCNLHNGISLDAKSVQQYKWKKEMEALIRKSILKSSEMGILDNEYFSSNMNSLRNAYNVYVLHEGEIDEGIFLSQGDTHQINKGLSDINEDLHPQTPLTRKDSLPNGESLQSPLTTATENLKFLRHLLPRVTLNLMGLSEALITHLSCLQEQFFANFITASEESKNSARNYFELAKALYLRLLDNIVKKEQIVNDKFDIKNLPITVHSSLFSISMEIVLYSYKSLNTFPWVVRCFELSLLNFQKIIELVVVNNSRDLTRDIIKHLNSIEEQCLESLLWASPSDVLIQINKHRISVGQSITFLQSKEESHTQHKSLALFMRKFYMLSRSRLTRIMEDLALDIYIEQVWPILEMIILRETQLLKDRHLDQIIMCVTYLYCKVKNLKRITFRDIMCAYRKQPGSKSDIYRKVLINAGKTGDIIEFYNSEFIAVLCEYVNEIRSQNLPSPNLSVHPPAPFRISEKYSLYVDTLDPKNSYLLCSSPKYMYSFNSPREERSVMKMNEFICTDNIINGKRAFDENENSSLSMKKRVQTTSTPPYTTVTKKLQSLINDRHENNERQFLQ